MHPQAQQLAETFINDFWAADHSIRWKAIEEDRQLWLNPNTLLIGRIDAQGYTSDDELFFGDWKTASAAKARRMAEEKTKWRSDPQALTYGVLLGPETKRFTVRWALKTPKPQTDFEWYTYSEAEIEHWRSQLIGIADEIREWRKENGEWRTNRANCFRYGVNYACPFANECIALNFNHNHNKPRQPHTELEAKLKQSGLSSDVVILSSSRVDDYLNCPEEYRKKWEGDGYSEESEALTIGHDFHSAIAAHLNSIKESQQNGRL